jgi:hypothetical protein
VKAKKPITSKLPDLRHGMHGSLMTNNIDAGQSTATDIGTLKPASPDERVPVGQTTHE